MIVPNKHIVIADKHCTDIQTNWFANPNEICTIDEFKNVAGEWFLSSKLVELHGVDGFKDVDVILGCTQYIESFFQRFGRDGFQILDREYSLYKYLGKRGVELEQLEPHKPVIVSVPDFFTGGVRPEFFQLLEIAEQRDIDIHLDMAWMVIAQDIRLDLSHPRIQSFAMSMSKLNLNWNRVGLRWSRKRKMDSITVLNHLHPHDIHMSIMSCGLHNIRHLDRDYQWNTYRDANKQICEQLGLTPTSFVSCVNPDPLGCSSITPLLLENVQC